MSDPETRDEPGATHCDGKEVSNSRNEDQSHVKAMPGRAAYWHYAAAAGLAGVAGLLIRDHFERKAENEAWQVLNRVEPSPMGRVFSPRRYSFRLARTSLLEALTEWSRVTHITFIYLGEEPLAAYQSGPIVGSFTAVEALTHLTSATPCRAVQSSNHSGTEKIHCESERTN